jgi:hypothetical protein
MEKRLTTKVHINNTVYYLQDVDNMTDVACAVMLNGGELEVREQAKAQAEANIQKELQG